MKKTKTEKLTDGTIYETWHDEITGRLARIRLTYLDGTVLDL